MYKINKVKRISENSEEITFYGIESESISYEDLSSDFERVKELCHFFNTYDIDERHIKEIIEDFLTL